MTYYIYRVDFNDERGTRWYSSRYALQNDIEIGRAHV